MLDKSSPMHSLPANHSYPNALNALQTKPLTALKTHLAQW